jgi:hypothetical protein
VQPSVYRSCAKPRGPRNVPKPPISREPRRARPLTLTLLPLTDDGIQPLLFLLSGLGHADKPLVLGRVVDLPTIGDSVAVAVVISWWGRK